MNGVLAAATNANVIEQCTDVSVGSLRLSSREDQGDDDISLCCCPFFIFLLEILYSFATFPPPIP
jgi:hypothetical protein